MPKPHYNCDIIKRWPLQLISKEKKSLNDNNNDSGVISHGGLHIKNSDIIR